MFFCVFHRLQLGYGSPLGISGTFSSKGSHLHTSPPVVAQRPLVSNGGRPSQSNPFVAVLRWRGTVVAPGVQVAVRSSATVSDPIPVVVYRCIPVWLGGPCARSDSLGGLVRGGEPGAHRAGNASNRTGSSCLPALVVGAVLS